MHISSSKKRLLLAAACGVAAAILVVVYTGGIEARAAQSRSAALAAYGGERVEVLVASRDIMAGETLDSSNSNMQPWLADLLPAGAFTAPDEAYGQQLSMPILKNEPVLAAKIGGMAEQIAVPDGLCALSIPAADVTAVGGAIVPGTAVDVYALGATAVQLVAADVMILESSNGYGSGAAGTGSGAGQSGSLFSNSGSRAALKWVTLAVEPSKVMELLAAARDQNLSLVLPGENVGAKLLNSESNSESNAESSSGSGSGSNPSSNSEAEDAAPANPVQLGGEAK